jgi:hypothetical protein
VRAARGSTVPENNNNLCVYTAKLVLIYVAWHDGVRGREWRGIFPAPSLLVHNKRRLSSSLALLIKYISRADFEFVRISLLRGVSERQIKAV